MHPVTLGEEVEISKIIGNSLEVSYLVGRINKTTKIMDLDPSQGQNFEK